MAAPAWRDYLADFHADRAGITEDLLSHTTDGGIDPYRWVADRLDASDRVLDLACGSGPIAARHPGPWVGMDISASELKRARARPPARAAPLVLADGVALPFAPGSFDAVACSMALMLIQPVEAALAEIARVLVPGGRLVALLPSAGPLRAGDVLRYGQLMVALRRRLTYPNDEALADAAPLLAAAGLSLLADERRRFACHVADPHIAALCVTSLYLPGTPPERLARALAVARGWIGHTLGVPLRLLVAER
jgi:SAM-dependent methyltransferase